MQVLLNLNSLLTWRSLQSIFNSKKSIFNSEKFIFIHQFRVQTFWWGVESIYLQFSKVALSHSNSQISFQRNCCVEYSSKSNIPVRSFCVARDVNQGAPGVNHYSDIPATFCCCQHTYICPRIYVYSLTHSNVHLQIQNTHKKCCLWYSTFIWNVLQIQIN